jgi:hypothetical protein
MVLRRWRPETDYFAGRRSRLPGYERRKIVIRVDLEASGGWRQRQNKHERQQIAEL